MKYLKVINKPVVLFAIFILFIIRGASAQYAVGDIGSTSSGNWGAAIWSTWNGASWILGGSPTSLTNVFVLNSSTVTVEASLKPCLNLTVEAGGILMAGPGTNLYVNVYGNSLVCNGQIGNGAVFDQISFNIEGANVTISGTGTFDASRMRKTFVSPNATTNLIIARDINLRWDNAASSSQLYNNCSLSNFNVTINAGATVALIQSGVGPGNVCIDGGSGADATEAGGTFTINGTLIISGILYFTTNNTNPSYRSKWVITGLVRTSEISAPASGISKDSLLVNNLGKLEITGTPAFSTLSTTNNVYNFNNGSTVEYSAAGAQNVRVRSEFGGGPLNSYYNLICSNSGLKSTTLTNLIVRYNLTITGLAILDPNPTNSIVQVGGNWTNYGSVGFSEKATTVILNGTIIQTITCPGGEVYNTIQYQNPSAHVQFNDSVDVITQLIYASNGYIDLNSNTFTVRNSAVTGIQGATSTRYIYSEKPDNSSKIVWRINSGTGIYIFPFGIPPGGAANYIPVVVTKLLQPASIGDLSFSTYGTPPTNLTWPVTPTNVTNLNAYIPQHNAPDNRHWTVDRFWEAGSTTPVALDSVRFSYRITELPDSEPSPTNLGAQFWNGTWWYNVQYGVPVAYNVGVDNFFVFNTSWTLTSLTSPLPIKLLYFDAKPLQDKVSLNWSTASETNNDYFTVEKSIDGENFYPIGLVNGSGNSTTILKYSLDDFKPVIGISYYRLKQTDYNGENTTSEILPIRYKKEGNPFSVFPNPANDKAYLISEADQKQEIFIRNSEGMLILYYLVEKSRYINSLTLTDLKTGLYFIEIKTESETQFLKLIKN